ncbi:MAG: anaerobic ribonucleoside-triphosphate reductase activating protein [Patescibacteria group bacterium]
MKFKGWQKLSLIERPDKICSVIFVGGCNFRCPWCYNKDIVLHPEKLPDIDEKEILEYLEKNKKFLDGAMITGGEPLVELKIELIDFIKKIKKIGLGVGIETNGSNPKAVEYLIQNKLIDYLAMDIKAPLKQEKYNQLTGVNISLDKIKKSIKIIVEKLPDYEFRTTVVPGVLNENDILEIAEYIKGAKRYYLQQFRFQKSWPYQPYPKEFFENLSKKIKNYFQIFGIRD